MSTLRRSIELAFVQDIYYAEFPLSETPYISTVDADEEIITICNPRSTELHLKDYYVVDRKRLHKFIFSTDDHVIQPHGTLFLYTCPKLTIEQGKTFRDPHVLWRNLDGTLRRKEVLNNDHCEMLLYAPNHKCIASCSSDRSGRHEIKRREEELQSLPSLTFSITTRIICSILRIVLLIAFAICALENHVYRIYLYWAAFALDVLSRETSNDHNTLSNDPNNNNITVNDHLHNPSSADNHLPADHKTSSSAIGLLRSLNSYGDDINLFVLYTAAIMHSSNNNPNIYNSVSSQPLNQLNNSSVFSHFFQSAADHPNNHTSTNDLSPITLLSSVFSFFHNNFSNTSSTITNMDGKSFMADTAGIAWSRLGFFLAALLEFTAMTASMDRLHWHRDEDVVYQILRATVHPVCVTCVAMGSEVFLLAYATLCDANLLSSSTVLLQNTASTTSNRTLHYFPWVMGCVLLCFILRQMNNLTVVYSCMFNTANSKNSKMHHK